MSQEIPESESVESAEETVETLITITAKPVNESGSKTDEKGDDETETNRNEETAAEFLVNGIDEPEREDKRDEETMEFPVNGIDEPKRDEETAEFPVNGIDELKRDEETAEFPVNGIDEPEGADRNMELDMPSLQLSDNDANEIDSPTDRPKKNHSLEEKLSAIIEKACSSDVECEDPPVTQPLILSTDGNVILANNELLPIMEGVTVCDEIVNDMTTQETAALPAESAQNSVAPRKTKRYMYKLKSKKQVLRYFSSVPIVLKKPCINLTRIDLGAMLKANGGTSVRGKRTKRSASISSVVNGKRGRGRPSLSEKKPSTPSSTLHHSVDVAANSNDSNSSYGMQTRKRKLKFAPDGRIMGGAKRQRDFSPSSSSASSEIGDNGDDPPPKESSDEDWQATDADLKELHSADKEILTPTPRKPATKCATSHSAKLATPQSTKSVIPQSVRVATALSKAEHNAGKTFVQKNTADKHIGSLSKALQNQMKPVNPAQLLSTLLGVTIRPSQLNMVRFKPKYLKKHNPSLQKTVIVTGGKPNSPKDEVKTSTPLKMATPKPLMQKILPKSSLASIKTALNKTLETQTTASTPSVLSMALRTDPVSSPFTDSYYEPPAKEPSFDDFTDSRTVRTKGGPKKVLLQKAKLDEKLNRLGVYDLVQDLFDRRPSWNLHIMPDTNTFCIAQLGRGRMGMPVLRKSVEISDDFAAKIFVHQLHCKKYDGVYDTESKLNSLIGDIDSLAA
ncbi:hypothetical protein V9T40_012217 [Parthenolecanium corni]|uniref:Uncharacterized protein n=1 Tax=Parthenolecanium corni TaxID=536013 RepID=A0AAN9TMR4_9HEMI